MPSDDKTHFSGLLSDHQVSAEKQYPCAVHYSLSFRSNTRVTLNMRIKTIFDCLLSVVVTEKCFELNFFYCFELNFNMTFSLRVSRSVRL